MKELGEIKPEHVKIQSSEKCVEGDYLFGAVCNSTRVGGGVIKFAKELVDMNDGLFEIVLVKMPNNPSEFMQLLVDLNSCNYKGSMFEFYSAENIRISSRAEMDWTLDGEYEKGSSLIEIENLHSAITLMMKRREETKTLPEKTGD